MILFSSLRIDLWLGPNWTLPIITSFVPQNKGRKYVIIGGGGYHENYFRNS